MAGRRFAFARWVLGAVAAAGAGAAGADDPPRETLPQPREARPDGPGPAPAATPDLYGPAQPRLPIDLATVIRLADGQNPTIAVAQARVQEALARLDQASVLWLPDLTVGPTYFRHTGVDQNRRGDVFDVVRSNVGIGGGPVLRVDTGNAYFGPLVARQLANATAADAQATRNDIQLEAVSAYLDLARAYAAVAVNADTLARAEQMLDRAEAASRAGLTKTAGDANRARAEVELRRAERAELEGRAGAASARLGRVLFLADSIELWPADPAVVPLTLVPPQPLDELVTVALATRPELAANRAAVLAADQRVRQARTAPLFPSLVAEYQAGGFGGGQRGYVGDFGGRGDFTVGAVWGLDNLGFGNRAEVRTRQAQLTQAQFRGAEEVARVRAEVQESARLAAARYRALAASQEAVRQAAVLYRKLEDTSFGMIDRRQYDPLEPLTAIQQLNQARVRYLDDVIEFTRAQFRLYTALGRPVLSGLPSVAATPVEVPVAPPPFAPEPARRTPAKKAPADGPAD